MGRLPVMGPPPSRYDEPSLPEDLSEADHWRQSAAARHPALAARRLEPGLEGLLEVRQFLGSRLVDLRVAVVQEVNRMIEEQEAETAAWLVALPGPAFSIFSVPDRDRVTQLPVLLQLLETIGYPDVPGLADDLNNGFDILGPLRPGPGWRPRSD